MSIWNEQANELTEQRQLAGEVITRILDLSLFGEQMMVWNDEDVIVYHLKKDSVISSLRTLKQQTYSEIQQQRIDTIFALLNEKEVHILAIQNDLQNLKGSFSILQERIPFIIQQTWEQ